MCPFSVKTKIIIIILIFIGMDLISNFSKRKSQRHEYIVTFVKYLMPTKLKIAHCKAPTSICHPHRKNLRRNASFHHHENTANVVKVSITYLLPPITYHGMHIFFCIYLQCLIMKMEIALMTMKHIKQLQELF